MTTETWEEYKYRVVVRIPNADDDGIERARILNDGIGSFRDLLAEEEPSQDDVPPRGWFGDL